VDGFSARVGATATVVLATMLTSCGGSPACPSSIDQAESGAFEARTNATVVATGIVARYVPAPKLEARGYDLEVRRIFWGDRPQASTFLRVPAEIPDVGPGQTVLIVAEPADRDWVLSQGTCVALRPIDESDLDAD
jgi:hypothetical protein